MAGYDVENENRNQWIHYTSKHQFRLETRKEILVGPVVNSATRAKEAKLTMNACRRLYRKELSTMAENKNSEHLLDCLVDSSIKISLLQVKSTQAVAINVSETCNELKETAGKSGVFLQYNASRLAAIRKKFQYLVMRGTYPPLPQPHDVDFASLKEPEEWALLFNFLLEFPSLVVRTAEDITNGRPSIHSICHFISKLCSLFSVYYRRVRILLEPRCHLIPIIHRRVLLVMSVEQVLENCFDLLNVRKIEQM